MQQLPFKISLSYMSVLLFNKETELGNPFSRLYKIKIFLNQGLIHIYICVCVCVCVCVYRQIDIFRKIPVKVKTGLLLCKYINIIYIYLRAYKKFCTYCLSHHGRSLSVISKSYGLVCHICSIDQLTSSINYIYIIKNIFFLFLSLLHRGLTDLSFMQY